MPSSCDNYLLCIMSDHDITASFSALTTSYSALTVSFSALGNEAMGENVCHTYICSLTFDFGYSFKEFPESLTLCHSCSIGKIRLRFGSDNLCSCLCLLIEFHLSF